MDYQRNGRFVPARTVPYDRAMPNSMPTGMPKEETSRRKVFPSLAMVYSPYQEFTMIYDYCKGFNSGTIFEELDKPLECMRCGK